VSVPSEQEVALLLLDPDNVETGEPQPCPRACFLGGGGGAGLIVDSCLIVAGFFLITSKPPCSRPSSLLACAYR
jgi:hypothetical protein